MSPLKIGVIVGSNSKDSINRKLAEALVKLAGKEADFEFLPIDHLPIYNRDNDTNQPQACLDFKLQIRKQDGILFVTPEHNRSLPAVLKNALDCGSRPPSDRAWSGIPAAMIGTSPGGPGSSMAQQHLRNILGFLGMPTMTQPEAYIQWKEGLVDAQGEVGATSKEFLTGYMQSFLAWVRLTHKR